MEHRTLLFTEHGSHLYGLNHADSDKDSYRVYLDHSRHSRALQTMEGQDDIFQINLTAFIRQVAKGTPQSLEALYSPIAERDAEYESFLLGMRPGRLQMLSTYRRTMKNFLFGGEREEDTDDFHHEPEASFKRRRHGFRYMLNLSEALRNNGVFNPRMSEADKEWATAQANDLSAGYGERALNMVAHAMRGHYLY